MVDVPPLARYDMLRARLPRDDDALTGVTSGTALIRTPPAEPPAPSATYHDGGWEALRQLHAASSGADGRTLVEVARERLADWSAQLARWRAQPGSPWIPYTEGGVDAITDFLDEVDVLGPDERPHDHPAGEQ